MSVSCRLSHKIHPGGGACHGLEYVFIPTLSTRRPHDLHVRRNFLTLTGLRPQILRHCDVTLAVPPHSNVHSSVDAATSVDGLPVTFTVCRKKVAFGQCLKLVGSGPALGDWNPELSPCMEWKEGDGWSTKVLQLSPGSYEFKFVIASGANDSILWEQGPNKVVTVEARPSNSRSSQVTVECEWEGTGATMKIIRDSDPATVHHSPISVSVDGYETDDESRPNHVYSRIDNHVVNEKQELNPLSSIQSSALLATSVAAVGGLLAVLFFRGSHKF
jgi:hypothetical protein